VLGDILELMTTLAGDWEYSGTITSETQLFGDLGLQSLDLVVLGTSIQERYGRLPFAEFLVEIGQRPEQDVSVGQLVEFICEHRGAPADGMAGGSPNGSAR
jgi:acyl carrier protein